MIHISEQTLPADNAVDIWMISLQDPELDLPELLSDDEISRFSRIIHPRARTDFLRTRTALRLILASYLSCPEEAIAFNYNENGKPELDVRASTLRFNLSHSGNYCILSVSNGCVVGVDIERFNINRDYAALAQRFFSADEYKLLENSSDVSLFYRMWVLKEAAVKARGMKLLAGLDRFECLMTESGALTVVDKQAQNDSENWSVRQWRPDDQTIAAVVVRCEKAEFIEKMLTSTT